MKRTLYHLIQQTLDRLFRQPPEDDGSTAKPVFDGIWLLMALLIGLPVVFQAVSMPRPLGTLIVIILAVMNLVAGLHLYLVRRAGRTRHK
ncbi:hypothetical protein [Kushneria phosphatilytica]|uniref:Uncharacterized protein n=1 Tax=Kushneria phosphatilytica TaxID=657387 RepID=A0A1S1NRG6_9GAMM|nr:hypothetical protein [Kushneria phosphatilytica]OHV07510.1 hypothetical protein BH688_14860 [Kushneria phosphatilytica]QEL09992.1 hypothetical protein FY550_01815 [Kushneria phosphatilytica]